MITKDLKILTDFCKGCATCEGVCPNYAIQVKRKEETGRYFPVLNQKLCQDCGLCYNACPSWPSDHLGIPFKSIKSCTPDQLIGPFINTYSGFANDQSIRISSSSGGIATALLTHQLESGQIDAAVSVHLEKGRPFGEAKVLLSRNPEEIQAAKGSKYLPVPLNKIIKEIISAGDIKQVGVVGLPCHIEGLKKARRFYKKLEGKIAFTIGLFCRQTKELGFTNLLLSRLGIDQANITSFAYRGSGWPGYIKAKLSNGSEKECSFFGQGLLLLWLLQTHTPTACMLCCDPTSESSDISIGDAWLREFSDNKEGVSIIITRTPKGESLIKDSESRKVISIHSLEPQKVAQSQIKRALMRKKVNYRSKLTALKPSGYNELKEIFTHQPLDLRGILALKEAALARRISSSKIFAWLFQKMTRL